MHAITMNPPLLLYPTRKRITKTSIRSKVKDGHDRIFWMENCAIQGRVISTIVKYLHHARLEECDNKKATRAVKNLFTTVVTVR
jgi:hypothetical protein